MSWLTEKTQVTTSPSGTKTPMRNQAGKAPLKKPSRKQMPDRAPVGMNIRKSPSPLRSGVVKKTNVNPITITRQRAAKQSEQNLTLANDNLEASKSPRDVRSGASSLGDPMDLSITTARLSLGSGGKSCGQRRSSRLASKYNGLPSGPMELCSQ